MFTSDPNSKSLIWIFLQCPQYSGFVYTYVSGKSLKLMLQL